MNSAMDAMGIAGGAKPKLITRFLSGTGNYIPTVDMARCLVRIQGGGGGGHASSTGGGGGAFVEVVVRVPIAGLAYVVGAGGAVATAGSPSSFGQFTANAGKGGQGAGVVGVGGLLGVGSISIDGTFRIGSVGVGGSLSGIAGGAGGLSSGNGMQAGSPFGADTQYATTPISNLLSPNGVGNGSGGDTWSGKGAASGVAGAANTGAGGGINAAGGSGYVEVWDLGA